MPTLITDGVLVADVAKVMKTSAARLQEELASLQLFVGVDWANRPMVTVEDAHALVTGKARRQHEANMAACARQAEVDVWSRRRDEAVQTTALQAQRELRPAAQVQEAACHAGRRFEEEDPPPDPSGLLR